ncbi:hypothetical protein A4A49_60398, partial [Nicotiana attenuata]
SCPLCTREPENAEHLFFKCGMASQIWDSLLEWQGIQRKAKGWYEEVQWAEVHAKGKSANSCIYRVCLVACVYHIWHERNLRIFQGKAMQKEAIIRVIAQEIHSRGSKYKKLDRKLQ